MLSSTCIATASDYFSAVFEIRLQTRTHIQTNKQNDYCMPPWLRPPRYNYYLGNVWQFNTYLKLWIYIYIYTFFCNEYFCCCFCYGSAWWQQWIYSLLFPILKAHIEKACPEALHYCPNNCDHTLQMKLSDVSQLNTLLLQALLYYSSFRWSDTLTRELGIAISLKWAARSLSMVASLR